MLEINNRSYRRSLKYQDAPKPLWKVIRTCLIVCVVLVIVAAGVGAVYVIRKGIEPAADTTYIQRSPSTSKALNPAY